MVKKYLNADSIMDVFQDRFRRIRVHEDTMLNVETLEARHCQ